MAGKTRRLDVVISGEDRSAGKAFKGVGDDADKLSTTLKAAGEKAGKGFSTGVEKGVDSDGFASKMKGFGDKVSGAFKTAMVGGAIAAGAVFVTGFLAELDQELQLDKLEAQLGGGEWAAEMGDIAGELYREAFGDSIGEVGDTLKRVMQQGLLPDDATNQQIEDLTRRFLTFTDVLDQDVNMAVQAVSSMLKTGIAKDGAEALDILTRGIQQGADKSEDLLETFQEYSTMFRDLGIDADDATGLLIQGLKGGARDADTVADALKEFAIRAQDASSASADGFELIGLNAEEMTRRVAEGGPAAREALDEVLDGLRNMKDPVARNAAAVELFGTKAEDLGDALFNMDLTGAAEGLGTVEGATDTLGSAYDNAKTKVETFKRQAMDKLTTFIGDKVIPALGTMKEFIGDNEGAFKVFGALIGGAVLIAVGAYTVSMISAAVATLAATWPILAVIAGLALLAAGVIYAYTHWDWFRDAVDAVMRFVKEKLWPALQTVAGWITGTLIPTIGDVIGKFAEWATKAGEIAADIKTKIGDVVTFVKDLPGKIATAASGMWDGIKNAFKSAINWIIRAWNNLEFKIPGFDPPGPGPKFGGFTLGMPDITPLALGGIVSSPTLALIGEAGPEAVVPLNSDYMAMAAGGGGDMYITVDARGAIGVDGTAVQRWLTNHLRSAAGKGIRWDEGLGR